MKLVAPGASNASSTIHEEGAPGVINPLSHSNLPVAASKPAAKALGGHAGTPMRVGPPGGTTNSSAHPDEEPQAMAKIKSEGEIMVRISSSSAKGLWIEFSMGLGRRPFDLQDVLMDAGCQLGC